MFEKFIGEEIPACVKIVLGLSGFSTLLSLDSITHSDILKIEDCITEHFSEIIIQLKCCHSEFYKSQMFFQKKFKFLPGHATLVAALPQYVKAYQIAYQKKIFELKGRYSFILNELIETAEANQFKSANQANYPDSVRYFAIYIFLLCGRACYNMLQSNLPIPSTPTICK